MTQPLVILCASQLALGVLLGALWRGSFSFLPLAAFLAGFTLPIVVGDWSDVPAAFRSLDAFVVMSATALGYFSITVPPLLVGALIAYGLQLLVRRTRKSRSA